MKTNEQTTVSKENYDVPNLSIIFFTPEDIITASGDDNNLGEWDKQSLW